MGGKLSKKKKGYDVSDPKEVKNDIAAVAAAQVAAKVEETLPPLVEEVTAKAVTAVEEVVGSAVAAVSEAVGITDKSKPSEVQAPAKEKPAPAPEPEPAAAPAPKPEPAAAPAPEPESAAAAPAAEPEPAAAPAPEPESAAAAPAAEPEPAAAPAPEPESAAAAPAPEPEPAAAPAPEPESAAAPAPEPEPAAAPAPEPEPAAAPAPEPEPASPAPEPEPAAAPAPEPEPAAAPAPEPEPAAAPAPEPESAAAAPAPEPEPAAAPAPEPEPAAAPAPEPEPVAAPAPEPEPAPAPEPEPAAAPPPEPEPAPALSEESASAVDDAVLVEPVESGSKETVIEMVSQTATLAELEDPVAALASEKLEESAIPETLSTVDEPAVTPEEPASAEPEQAATPEAPVGEETEAQIEVGIRISGDDSGLHTGEAQAAKLLEEKSEEVVAKEPFGPEAAAEPVPEIVISDTASGCEITAECEEAPKAEVPCPEPDLEVENGELESPVVEAITEVNGECADSTDTTIKQTEECVNGSESPVETPVNITDFELKKDINLSGDVPDVPDAVSDMVEGLSSTEITQAV